MQRRHYFFEKKVLQDEDLYNSFIPLNDILTVSISGIKTHRDHFITSNSKIELNSRLQSFIDLPLESIKQSLNLEDGGGFSIAYVKDSFTEIDDTKFYNYSFKPFHNKIIYYDSRFITRDRVSVMGSFTTKHSNLGLIVKKRYAGGKYTHCFITNKLTDMNFLGGESYVFPLYKYSQNIGFSVSNIHPVFEEKINGIYLKNDLTEHIFDYIYAILYSNIYRQQFAGSLKMNFPRIPFPKSYDLFNTISKLGEKLVNLHLLLSPELSKPNVKFIGDGDCLIQSLQYDAINQKLYINNNQYFNNISKQIWEFEVGNNKVVQQYFKSKDNKTLSLSDTIQFCKIASAIAITLTTQNDIDKIYPDIIANPIR